MAFLLPQGHMLRLLSLLARPARVDYNEARVTALGFCHHRRAQRENFV